LERKLNVTFLLRFVI